jgi:hypothetical protein
MDPVVHFEMPYGDSDRVSKFYNAAFGWKMKMLGQEMGHYVLATTCATDAAGVPKKLGMIGGGFFAKTPDVPPQPSVVIAVVDIKEAMGKVAGSGGQVLGQPMDIPGIGAYVAFTDTEGNRVGMLQPLPMKKAAKKKPAAKKKAAAKKKPVAKKRPAAKRKAKRRA